MNNEPVIKYFILGNVVLSTLQQQYSRKFYNTRMFYCWLPTSSCAKKAPSVAGLSNVLYRVAKMDVVKVFLERRIRKIYLMQIRKLICCGVRTRKDLICINYICRLHTWKPIRINMKNVDYCVIVFCLYWFNLRIDRPNNMLGLKWKTLQKGQ